MITPTLRFAAFITRRWLCQICTCFLIYGAGLALAAAQTGTIIGRVSNAATGVYLESATIAVEGTTLQTVTARAGD